MGRYRTGLGRLNKVPISNSQILQAFLKAGPDVYYSGEALAQELSISRVAVHARIKKLEQSGIRFDAVPRKGYRLLAEPEFLHADLLDAHLQVAKVPLDSCTLLEVVDSTNYEVDRRLSQNAGAPLAILAHQQTHGRGRLGRKWHSDSNGNLYLSVGFRPGAESTEISLFSLWAGVRIAESLRQFLDIPVQVKWPNDLHVEGKKIAGILCEAKMELGRVQTLVFGFGLNVNQDASTLPDDLRTPASSIKTILGGATDIHPVTLRVIQSVLRAYEDCSKPDSGVALQANFHALDTLLGKPVEIQAGNVQKSGVARGIDEQGNLLLECKDGLISTISSGDVSVIPTI